MSEFENNNMNEIDDEVTSEFDNKTTPITYLVWVLLWVNAIKDAYLWMDAPDCFFFKNDFVHWNHDITSSLRKANWKHRILSTIADADNVVDNRNDKFLKTLKDMASKEYVNVCFVSSMPMAQVLWTDYDWIVNEVKDTLNKSIFHIPSRSMTDCWLEWYSDLLFSISKNIDITWWKPEKKNVAIVGNLFDRWEGDCIGNVIELRRILEKLWLNVVSIWLDWWNYEDILKVKDAWTIISLPYWRKAAKKIAKRLKADLLELDLPFWLDKTWEFINKIWSHFWIEEIAENFIKEELTINNRIEIIKWAIPHTFMWKKIAINADPYILNGMISLSKTLGFSLEKIYIHGDEKHLVNNKNIELDWLKIEYWIDWSWLENIDLIISNSHTNFHAWDSRMKSIQFGFPSYDYHVYAYEPYLGYRGALAFINRIANTLNK